MVRPQATRVEDDASAKIFRPIYAVKLPSRNSLDMPTAYPRTTDLTSFLYPILVYLQLGPTVSDYYMIIERRQYYAKINEYKPYTARA